MISLQKGRRLQQRHSETLSAGRHKIKCCFGRFKQGRAFVTRSDQTAASFSAAAYFIVVLDWLC